MESVLISYLVLGMLLLADAKESYKCSENPDKECRFPFTYKGKVYNECVDGWHYWCYIDDAENYEHCKLCEVPDATTTDLINATSAKTTPSADSNLLSTVWATAKSVVTSKAPTIDIEHEASTISALRSTTTVSPVSSSALTLQTSRSAESRNNPDSEATTTTAYIDATSESADSDLSSTVRMTAKPVTTNKTSKIDPDNHIEASAISSNATDVEDKATNSRSLSFIVTSVLRSTTTVSSVASSDSSLQRTSPPSENKESKVSRCSMNKEYPCQFPFEHGGKQHYECIYSSWTRNYWCKNEEPLTHFAYCEICDDEEESVQVLDSRNLKTANILAVSTADKISTGMTTTQKAIDPRLVKVPTHRNSATDNYDQDEDGDKSNGKSGHVTIILIILLLLVIITGVFVIVLCLRRRRLRASKHQEAEIGESGDNLLKQNGSDKSVSADGSQEMQPLNENCGKTTPGDDVVIKDGTDSKIDRKATVTV